MGTAIEGSTAIAGYLALFAAVGVAFVFVNLLIGRFLRPNNAHKEKLEIYECGEPSIGSSFVQFDLRFYVVALVFIIFDVEVAFLFPWATVFGKVTNLRNDDRIALVAAYDGVARLSPEAAGAYLEMGDPSGIEGREIDRSELELRNGLVVIDPETHRAVLEFAGLKQIVQFAVATVSFFFVVLLIGFAYEWRTGALNWVRAMSPPAQAPAQRTVSPRGSAQGSVLST